MYRLSDKEMYIEEYEPVNHLEMEIARVKRLKPQTEEEAEASFGFWDRVFCVLGR